MIKFADDSDFRELRKLLRALSKDLAEQLDRLDTGGNSVRVRYDVHQDDSGAFINVRVEKAPN